MVQFSENGGIIIGGNTYDSPGIGALFLAPSPARTRLCLFVTGIGTRGLERAMLSLPFRSGVNVPDYLVVGTGFGDVYSDDPEKGDGRSPPRNGPFSTGLGGALASHYAQPSDDNTNTNNFLHY